MLKFVRFALLSVTLASGAAVLTGCSGSGSSSFRAPAGVERFAGTYTGTFTGVISPGVPGAGSTVGGTFTAVINRQGNISGTLSQPGFPNLPITGTINDDGKINASANLTSGQVSTLTAELTLSNGGYDIDGTFVTKAGNVTVVTGTISS